MKFYLIIFVFILITNIQAQLPHTFTQTAHINEAGGWSVAVASDGTVFLGGGGLRAYTYNGVSFINTAYIISGLPFSLANNITVGSDGTVFVVYCPRLPPGSPNDGLRAYSYDNTSFTNTDIYIVDNMP